MKSWPDPRVEDFLDHLCVPLVGVVPYERREELRREIREHVLSLIEDGEEQGLSPAEAVEAALREIGEPTQAGLDFLEEWTQGEPGSGERAMRARSTKVAFAGLGSFLAIDLVALESLARLDRFVSPFTPPILALLAASPLLAGALIGALTPPRLRHGLASGLVFTALAAGIFAFIAWPETYGLIFFAYHIVFWGPVAHFVAVPVASVTSRLRNRRFWRRVRIRPPVSALG